MVRTLSALFALLAVLIGNASGLLGEDDFGLLPPEEAFKLDFVRHDDGSATSRFNVADGYYLYRDKFSFSVDGRSLFARFPAGKKIDDPFFGATEIYDQSIRLDFAPQSVPASGVLQVGFQGCAKIGVCYPPQTQTIALGQAFIGSTPPASADVAQGFQSQQDRATTMLHEGGIWATVVLFFLAGVLLAFTPCVLPMVPILSSIIVGHNPTGGKARSLLISLVYVLSTAVTYTAFGIAAGMLGKGFQAALQTPLVLGTMALVFVLLALSMFHVFPLQVPAFIQKRLTTISARQKAGSWSGVAVMGFLSALIVGPCVAPALAGALLYISQSGDAARGGIALFALSMGMGLPLVAYGVSAGYLLPKVGAWMDVIRAVIGVFMVAVALWLLDRVVPAALSMLLWAALLIICAVYMGALEPLGKRGWPALHKGLAWLLLSGGVILLIGVASGGRSLLQPLGALTPEAANTSTQQSLFRPVKAESLEEYLAQYSGRAQPVLVYVTAEWCVVCRELEAFTFTGDPFVNSVRKVQALKVDVSENSVANNALLQRFQLFGPPALLFFDRRGRQHKNLTVIGMISAKNLALRIDDVARK